MRFSVSSVAAVPFLFIVGALARSPPNDGGGSAVRQGWVPNKYQYIVLIETTAFISDRKHTELCTGVVLDAYHILTTASCLKPCYRAESWNFRIKLGMSELSQTPQMELHLSLLVEDFTFKVHKDYKTCRPDKDLAMITTKASLDKFALSPFNFKPLADQVGDAKLVVWGKSGALRERRAQYQNRSTCGELATPWADGRGPSVCALLADRPRICPIDNGAPLLVYNPARRIYEVRGLLTLSPFVAGSTATSCPLRRNTKYLFFSAPKGPNNPYVWRDVEEPRGREPLHRPNITVSGERRHLSGLGLPFEPPDFWSESEESDELDDSGGSEELEELLAELLSDYAD